jgi:hypothetical protein
MTTAHVLTAELDTIQSPVTAKALYISRTVLVWTRPIPSSAEFKDRYLLAVILSYGVKKIRVGRK